MWIIGLIILFVIFVLGGSFYMAFDQSMGNSANA